MKSPKEGWVVNKMKNVNTPNAPAAIGPYSQATLFHGLVFTSGQIALDPTSGELVGSNITEQTEQVMKNLVAILEAAGTDTDHVLKTTCYLADMNDFAAFNEVYGATFSAKPARSCVAVKELPKGALVEVEAIALNKSTLEARGPHGGPHGHRRPMPEGPEGPDPEHAKKMHHKHHHHHVDDASEDTPAEPANEA